jgi:hypothetical protein
MRHRLWIECAIKTNGNRGKGGHEQETLVVTMIGKAAYVFVESRSFPPVSRTAPRRRIIDPQR